MTTTKTQVINAKKMKVAKSNKVRDKYTWLEWVSLVVLAAYTLLMVFLLCWGLINSFKVRGDFNGGNIMGLPKPFSLQSYSDVFEQFYVSVVQNGSIVQVTPLGMIVNSVLYAGVGAVVNVLAPCMMAYVAQKFPCWYSKLITWVVIVMMAFPIVGENAAKIQLLRTFGLYGSMWGSWVLKFTFTSMYYLVFYNSFKGVSKEYYEAAYLDGAGEVRVMLRIILPIVKNVVFTVLLLRFVAYWNEYELPMLLLPNKPVLAVGIYELSRTTELNAVPQRLAGCMVLMVPILIVYFACSKALFGNISMGGLKE